MRQSDVAVGLEVTVAGLSKGLDCFLEQILHDRITPLHDLRQSALRRLACFILACQSRLRPDPTSQTGDAAARDRWGVYYRLFVNKSQRKGEQIVKNDGKIGKYCKF